MEVARDWVIRHDRGLTLLETREFERWQKAFPEHAAAWAYASEAWAGLGRMNPKFAKYVKVTRPMVSRQWVLAGLAAAAALAIGLGIQWWSVAGIPTSEHTAPSVAAVDGVRLVMLSDGTAVYLKAGSEIAERITKTERRVLLLRGEAHFDVVKDPTWPFVVRAGSVEVRAVGTAFNVEMQAGAVEVEVTEGRVRVAPGQPLIGTTPAASTREVPLVVAGQRAVVQAAANASASVQIAKMDAKQMTEAVAWQEPLLRLGAGKTLEQLAVEFSQRTGRSLTFADPEIKDIRVGGRIRADDLESFVWVMESYELTSEQGPDGGIILHKAR